MPENVDWEPVCSSRRVPRGRGASHRPYWANAWHRAAPPDTPAASDLLDPVHGESRSNRSDRHATPRPTRRAIALGLAPVNVLDGNSGSLTLKLRLVHVNVGPAEAVAAHGGAGQRLLGR